MPVINPTKVKVYKISDTVEKHDFRNRPVDKENSYDFFKVMKIQPVWYANKEIRQLEVHDRLQSSGYFIFKNKHLKRLSINPADNNSWGRYRFLPKINGTYSNEYLEIVEIRPESPLRGTFKLWYAYFHEVRPEPKSVLTESAVESRGDFAKDINQVVDLIRRTTNE